MDKYNVYQGEERRKFPRIKKSLIAGFRKLDFFDEFPECETENVSEGGFKIDVPYLIKALSIGYLIELELKSSKKAKKSVRGIGKIVWIAKKTEGAGFEIGVQLTLIKSEDRQLFEKFLGSDIVLKER